MMAFHIWQIRSFCKKSEHRGCNFLTFSDIFLNPTSEFQIANFAIYKSSNAAKIEFSNGIRSIRYLLPEIIKCFNYKCGSSRSSCLALIQRCPTTHQDLFLTLHDEDGHKNTYYLCVFIYLKIIYLKNSTCQS